LDLRQGKRLFAFLGTGPVLAEVLGGTAAPLVAPAFGVPVLLDAAAVALAAGLVLGRRTLHGHSALHPPPAEEDRLALAALFRRRYLVLILGVFGLAAVSWYLIDFAFCDRLAARCESAAEMASWLGTFFAAAAGLTLLTQSMAAPRLLDRAGVRLLL